MKNKKKKDERRIRKKLNEELIEEDSSSIPGIKNLPKTIIFVGRRSDCDQLVRILIRLGYTADSLHGDRTQIMRDKAMDKFRSGSTRILVATEDSLFQE